MKRQASIYDRAGRYFIATTVRSVSLWWIDRDPHAELPSDTSDSELGKALLAALEQSIIDVPDPTQESLRDRRGFLKIVGASSLSAFSEGSRHIGISQEGSRLDLYPSRNDGPRKGFAYLKDWITLQDPSPTELGAEVRRAFDLCTVAAPKRRRVQRVPED